MKNYTKILLGLALIAVVAILNRPWEDLKPQISSAAAATPALPQVFIDTTYPTLSSTRTVRSVKSSCTGVSNCTTSLQTAIDNAAQGDEIVVDAGMVITGTITLKNKTTGSGWIVIRTSNMSGITAAGVRVSPANASAMPKIVSPGGSGSAIVTEDKAHNYRIVGIEVADAPDDSANELIGLGKEDSYCATSTNAYVVCTDQTVLNNLPYNIVLDRMYIHGDPVHNVKRGVGLNSKAAAVIDSYISDIHVVGQDNQAIFGAYGPGPYKIVNNYLEAAAENVIFGGDDPRVANLVPSDIEVRNNYFNKPLRWRQGDPSYAGIFWQVKNILELKNAQRVLVDGNIFEHSWKSAQDGYGIVMTPRNQGGNCPWCTVQDVTFKNNLIRHVASGLSLLGHDDEHSSALAQRLMITNNVWEDISSSNWGGSGWFALINGGINSPGPSDVTITHNTAFNDSTWLYAISYYSSTATFSTKPNAVITDNIGIHNTYGVFGDNSGTGNPTLSNYFPGVAFTKNVLLGGASKSFSSYAGNFFPTDWSGVFVNQAAGDYHVLTTSVYHNAATDGTDIGANINTVNSATAGVVSGNSSGTNPPPPPPPGPTPTPTPTPAPTPTPTPTPTPSPTITTRTISIPTMEGRTDKSITGVIYVYTSTGSYIKNLSFYH
jgi:hypothetical protein